MKGFALGARVKGKTKGIWIWGEPISYKGRIILLLDTEGLHDTDNGVDYDAKIFSLSILLCSFFIYNSMTNIDSASIGQLGFITELVKLIQNPLWQGDSRRR